ncbi:hemolysin family protein [uncultured Sutterella sp.]|uniref:hemolysin family protein n=1 Tax=uncultured Sutterella sp. TaxID=286133 RepID=UPI0025E19D54|nr:hemolysin family protein [uncultured Sutterella sp.]
MLMDSLPQVAALFGLVLLSAFFSSSEISLASASKTRLQTLADDGDRRAALVLELQSHPGQFFSALQVLVNAAALLGGVIGDAAFSPFFDWVFSIVLPGQNLSHVSFIISFIIATTLFVIFADLLPKRLAIARPEATAMFVVRPMNVLIKCLRPIVFVLERLSDACIRSLGMPTKRQETITSEDILASVGAGAAAGVIAPEEETVIQNVFELESRLVPSAMTARESIVYFTLDETDESIRAKISTVPYNRFLVCDKDLDHVVGFVDSKHLLRRVLEEKPILFQDPELLQGVQFIPDSLTLSEVLDVFQRTHTDFAVILNEYALVVGIITINDVMATVMGDLVTNEDDVQIIQRDADTWLVDGATPIDDLEHALEIDELPEDSAYETVAGFMMYMLRKIPKRTDKVVCADYTFEVMDVDNNKIDQVLITRNKKKIEKPAE